MECVASDNKILELTPFPVDWTPVLEELRLRKNFIVSVQVGVFQNLTALRFLDLSGNSLETLPDLSRCAKLEVLDLSRNSLGKFDSCASNAKLRWHPTEGSIKHRARSIRMAAAAHAFGQTACCCLRRAQGLSRSPGSAAGTYCMRVALRAFRLAR